MLIVAAVPLSLVIVKVQGSSMRPTFHNGDTLIAIRIPHFLIRPGSVVISKSPIPSGFGTVPWPVSAMRASDLWVVKRVRATPGQWVPDDTSPQRARERLAPRHYFLQGDAPDSLDSRHWGPVPSSHIRGIVLFRWPLSRA